MKKYVGLIIVLPFFWKANAQVLTQATTSQDIVNQIPGFSQVITVNTVTVAYTPPTPPTPPTPVDGDTTTEEDGIYNYGSSLTASFSLGNGNFTNTSFGKVWTLRISVPNALNVGLLFTQFNLAASAEMYIYNDAKTVLKYKIKKSDFTVSDTVSISSLTGNAITVYIIEVGNSGAFQSSITISTVVAGYQPISDVGTVGSGTAPIQTGATINCIPHIMCYSQYMPSARAVARIAIPRNNVYGYCSCTLLNNEQNNGRAFILTAFHCLDANKDEILQINEIQALRQSVIQFQFWRTVCNGTVNNAGIEFGGAVIRAASPISDFVLLELLNAPGIGDGVNYAGWNRQTAGPDGTQSFIIHHPLSEDMRFTQTSSIRTFVFNSAYWQAYYSIGVVYFGSSGSALFNQNTQVIGQLSRGWSSCNFTNFSDRYGKFSQSWSSPGMQQSLSPNQNLISTSNLILSPLTIQGPNSITCNGGTGQFSVSNLLGATYNWSVSSNLSIISGLNTPTITVKNTGSGNSGTVTLIVSTPNKGRTRSLTVSNTIGTGAPVLSITSTPGACNNGIQTWSLSASSLSPVTSWQWTVDNPSSGTWFIYNPNSPNTFVDVKGGGGISVTATNSCGTAKNGVTIFSNCPHFAISPNPASTSVTISSKNNSGKSETISEVNIYDQSGAMKKHQIYSNIMSVSIDISNLTIGNYIIEIVEGKYKEKQHFQVNRR